MCIRDRYRKDEDEIVVNKISDLFSIERKNGDREKLFNYQPKETINNLIHATRQKRYQWLDENRPVAQCGNRYENDNLYNLMPQYERKLYSTLRDGDIVQVSRAVEYPFSVSTTQRMWRSKYNY
eukprot:TRINITY_DN10775_c0_g2_i1.p1 TRINITY_DN10775_c0_g2~~TRINITY_DN10775_c0_g2_i1.p1  ORF type:complete len:124 (+),score=14.47 TRINITY_DN10775_c0_g2_i1:79-450(+)